MGEDLTYTAEPLGDRVAVATLNPHSLPGYELIDELSLPITAHAA